MLDQFRRRIKIVGEIDGVPIKRYGSSIHTARRRKPSQSHQAKVNRFNRLSKSRKAAAIRKRQILDAKKRHELLKAQRLAVLGGSSKRIGEAQPPLVHSNMAIQGSAAAD